MRSCSASTHDDSDIAVREGDLCISKQGVSLSTPSGTTPSRSDSPAHSSQPQPPERKRICTLAEAGGAHDDSAIATASSEHKEDRSTPPFTSRQQQDINLDELHLAGAIGKGNGGIVQAGVHKPSGQRVALKRIHFPAADDETRKRVVQELRALKRSDSEFIVPLLGASVQENTILAALEYMGGGSLKDLLDAGGKLPESSLRPVAACTLEALAYLHSRLHIVHRDVKPANVLLGTDGTVKLGDLGVSGQLADSLGNCHSWVGTMSFMSPERLSGEPHSYASDTWSFGLTLVECAIGDFPYAQTGKGCFWDLLDSIVHNDPPTLDSTHDRQLSDLVSQCLVKDPSERPLAANLRSHTFLLRTSELQLALASLITERLGCRESSQVSDMTEQDEMLKTLHGRRNSASNGAKS